MPSIVKAGWLIDGTGVAPRRDAAIVVENGRIIRIDANGCHLSDDAQVFDATQYFVIPGLIDTHVHLGSPTGVDLATFRMHTSKSLMLFYAAQAAQATLAAGFTTVRNMGGIEFTALKQAVDRGLLPGPRLVVAAMVLMTAGHTDRLYPEHYTRGPDHTADGIFAVRRQVRQFMRRGADFVKVEATGGLIAKDDTPDVLGYSDEELVAAAEAAHQFGKRLAVHAHSSDGVRRAVQAGADTVEHCTWADEDALRCVAERGAYITVTCSILEDAVRRLKAGGATPPMLQNLEDALQNKFRVLSTAREQGVKVALGTDACGKYVPHGQNALELELLCRAGFSPMESLLAGTKVAAEALGLDTELGTLEPGKRADLVIVSRNPLEDIAVLQDRENILWVFKDGVPIVDRVSSVATDPLTWNIVRG